MLDDRSYMQDTGRNHRFSATVTLMIVLGVCYAAQYFVPRIFHSDFIDDQLPLSTAGLLHGKIWQLITFQFLHGSLTHIIFNLLALWSLGRWVENVYGRRGLYLFFLLSGIAGGVFHALAGIVTSAWAVPVVGASAGTMGLLAACCVMEPDGMMMLYFIPVRARYALILAVGLSAFFTLVPRWGGGIAHTAHLGGLLAGLAFMRYGLPSSSWMDAIGDWWRVRARGTVSGRRMNPSGRGPIRSSEPQTGGDFISREIDPILEKISAQGIHSLTAEERRILEAAQKRMNR